MNNFLTNASISKQSELARNARKTCKLDKVDWVCGNGHITKGVAEGKANPCDLCSQTFNERLEIFLQLG